MSIKTLVFDFGNVLAHFSHRRSANQVAALADADPDAVLAFLYGGQLERDFDSGRFDETAYRSLVRKHFGFTCSDEAFDYALGNMFEPNDAVCALIPRLTASHRLVLLSNTNGIHSRWFRVQLADTLRFFQHIVLSHEVGLYKPEAAIYRYCEKIAGSRPEECVFIDDIPKNVEGAVTCGWHGIVYRPEEDLAAGLASLGVRYVVLGAVLRTAPAAGSRGSANRG